MAPVTSPYSPAGANDINADKTVAFIPVTLNQQSRTLTQPEAKRFVDTATSADGPTTSRWRLPASWPSWPTGSPSAARGPG